MNAFINMSAKSRSAATLDSQQHFDVQPVQPGTVAFDEAFAMLAKNIDHLQGGPTHFLMSFRDRFT
jgi:hypothetical protein